VKKRKGNGHVKKTEWMEEGLTHGRSSSAGGLRCKNNLEKKGSTGQRVMTWSIEKTKGGGKRNDYAVFER